MTWNQENVVSQIKSAITQGRPELLDLLFEELQPADIADLLVFLDRKEQKAVILQLSNEDGARVFENLEARLQQSLLADLGSIKAAEILESMSSDDIADFVGELSPQEAQAVLNLMPHDEAKEITDLMVYPEHSAGGLMTTEFLSLEQHHSVDDAISAIRHVSEANSSLYYVYVTSQERLVGVVSLRQLILTSSSSILKDIMEDNLITVGPEADQEEVAKIVSKYDLLAVPVVDACQHLLGIITVDDILDVVQEEATEDIFRSRGAAGMENLDPVHSPVLKKVAQRLPWLVITLFAGLISGSIVGAYAEAIQAVVILAMFIPVIMDMGGNAATQASTVFVRGVATGEITAREQIRYFAQEVRVGLIMATVCGATLGIVVALWQQPILGLVVGTAMFSTVTVGTVVGTGVPLVFTRLGIDPAYGSGPMVTSIKDATGLLIFFSIATLFMSYLK
ncbi:MAG: magnesium transporter [Firmicutes bacterium]|nr:magnesium transporter [Dethiobacter sp.]MBS3889382.1 magnesium transporter [Bacillota bacterium]